VSSNAGFECCPFFLNKAQLKLCFVSGREGVPVHSFQSIMGFGAMRYASSARTADHLSLDEFPNKRQNILTVKEKPHFNVVCTIQVFNI
jgi:hypothetical protein